VEKMKLTSGHHVSADGYWEGIKNKRREPKEKAYFCNYANGVRGLSGLGRPVGFGLQERRGQQGPARPKAEWAARSAGPKGRKMNFRIKNWIFEFTKALKICRRRSRRNFDMRIFPKFF
jgi:hypothetical protein